MKKVLSLVLTTAICITSLYFTPIKSEAAAVSNSNTVLVQEINSGNGNVETYTFDVSTFQSGQLSDAEIGSQKNAVTKAVKWLLKNIIKHGDEVAKIVEKVSGKTVAKNFLKYHGVISDALTPLLEYSEIPKNLVYTTVLNAIKDAGASEAVATNIALAIKEAWEWLVF